MLSRTYDLFVKSEGDRWKRYDENTKLLMMEEYIGSLLWLDTAVWRELDELRDLQQALRAGRVTEGLCPPSLLNAIISLAEGHALRGLPQEWYYENVRVEQMMIQQGLMTFRVTLPFTDARVYKRYDIQAYKYGQATSACPGGIRHRPGHAERFLVRAYNLHPCERGLITSHAPDRSHCRIESTHTNLTTALELEEGTFVLQTLGEDVRLACKGQVQ